MGLRNGGLAGPPHPPPPQKLGGGGIAPLSGETWLNFEDRANTLHPPHDIIPTEADPTLSRACLIPELRLEADPTWPGPTGWELRSELDLEKPEELDCRVLNGLTGGVEDETCLETGRGLGPGPLNPWDVGGGLGPL